ncbi:MAG: hypothetical protein ACYS15_00510 [Planctomycetota bacterium]|jgi:hypothetical protein
MRKSHWVVVGGVACVSVGTAVLWGAGEGEPPPLTQIEEVVMYGIDADTYELMRYEFNTDAYFSLGVVKDQHDNEVKDIEGLALIPHGLHKGLYGTANYYEQWPSKLVKISGLDARCQVHTATIGFEKVEGLVAAQDPDTLEWSLLGVSKNPNPSLIRIDPATGVGTLIMETDNRYLGLAMDPDGTIYGVTKDPAELWKIDPISQDESSIGQFDGYTKLEALEYAFGNGDPRIKIPMMGHDVVPDSWTMSGVLFGFADDDDALLIINAQNADNVQWQCSFQTINCEGLVFTTQAADPYGPIVNTAGD